MCCFFFHYVSAKFHLWPSSGDLPRPRIGMLSLVTVSPLINAFHSCFLSHHVFDQVNLWPAWVGFETAIFWQCSPGTVETQRLYPLRHGPRRFLLDVVNQKKFKQAFGLSVACQIHVCVCVCDLACQVAQLFSQLYSGLETIECVYQSHQKLFIHVPSTLLIWYPLIMKTA